MEGNDTLRIFFAINLPDAIKEQVATVIDELQQHYDDEIRWVRPRSLHITLQFLKSFAEKDLSTLIQKVTEKIQATHPFSIQLDALELFPSNHHPNIVSVSIPALEPLSHLSLLLGEALTELNYPTEQRPFRAHLTLGRINRGVRRRHIALSEFSSANIFPVIFETAEVILYRSHPERGPSDYIALHTFPFPLKMAPI